VTRIGAAIALTLALAAPAAADTVARRTPAVGPALAGDLVAWGEESRTGAVRIVVGAPGREPLLAYRIRPATARRTDRAFMHIPAAFAASATTFAALMYTGTVTQSGSDSVSTAVTLAAVAGPFRGPVTALSGSIPARGDAPCRAPHSSPEAVDVDGDRIAVGAAGYDCRPDSARPLSVTVYDGGRQSGVPVPDGEIRHVELAGRFVAWIHRGAVETLVVHDLESGVDVARVTTHDVGARSIDDAALQADGTVAFTHGGRRDRRGVRLGVLVPGLPGTRILDRHVSDRGLAVAAGRVLYERVLDRDGFERDLILGSLSGGPVRRLGHFSERRRRVGEIDLDATRATWADLPTRRGHDPLPRGPGRIVVRGL
jgi:hypothetical protein